MSTTVDSAEGDGAREQPGARSRREVRRAQEARAGFWRGSIVAGFFILVLAANLFFGAVVMVGALRTQTHETVAYAKSGRMSLPVGDGTKCRYIVFDNKSSRALEDRISPCSDDRAVSTRKGSTTFSWGGH
jgi:hypothetical protein